MPVNKGEINFLLMELKPVFFGLKAQHTLAQGNVLKGQRLGVGNNENNPHALQGQ